MSRQRILIASILVAGAFLFIATPLRAAETAAAVKVSEQDIVIPTYLVAPPDPNPQFYNGRQSQGAQQMIYPYPVYDNLTNNKVDKTYKIVYLENEYIKVGILPEIGGRIFEAIDKTNGYNFFYRQHVIKPALISLLGAWISGGVEWDVPHHHRATSFLPVQYKIEDHADGSKTVWVGELELRQRMRWAVGTTIHPGKSYLDVAFRMINRTPMVNTMLCFSNVAVHVDDSYQVIFPPSTQHVTYHFKRDFTTWPIATTRFNGTDFSAGVDVSWYKNHYNSNSMFAWNYQDDFFAGYDHGKQAGTMSIADHNVVPGKKFWTWGNGPRGKVEDKALTDSDGPYIELMVGAYSDNQPDYSWLQPYETKTWQQYWYPFRDIDGVKCANIDAAVNLEVKDGKAKLGFNATSAHSAATVLLKLKEQTLLTEQIAISPGKPYTKEIALPVGADEHDLRASLSDDGKELVAYAPLRLVPEAMPAPVTNPPAPADIKSNEELYLAGLRLEQFHSPSQSPVPYWEEALKRDPGDVRVNTVLGIDAIRQVKFADAEKLLRKALERATDKYTSPKDGEPFYYLGVALKAQGKMDEAYAAFYKATWSTAWRDAAYFSAAEVASMRGDLASALSLVDHSLEANALNIRALELKSALLRNLGRKEDALALAPAIARIDPLDVHGITEHWLAGKDSQLEKELRQTLNGHPANALETAAEYMTAGLWQDGAAILNLAIDASPDKKKLSPLVYDDLAYIAQKRGEKVHAAENYILAGKAPPDYVFPYQWEMIDVLDQAMAANPSDPQTPYFLGNLLFDSQPQRATALWEQSATLGAAFPVVYRNLAYVYTSARQDAAAGNESRRKAIAALEKCAQFGGSAMAFYDLDILYEQIAAPPEKRLATFEQHQQVVDRDDSISREINLKIFAGKYDDAIGYMKARAFHVWEGGPRIAVGDSWVNAMLGRGRQHLAVKQYKEALDDFQGSMQLPENLIETNNASGPRQAEINYYIGLAYEGLGDADNARKAWTTSAGSAAAAPVAAVQTPATNPSAQATSAPARAGRGAGRGQGRGAAGGRGGGRGFAGGFGGFRSNIDVPYFQALSLQKLGGKDRASQLFQQLVASGQQTLTNNAAVADPTGMSANERARMAEAHYLIGLGNAGLEQKDAARKEFTQALGATPDHLGAKQALTSIGG